MLFLRLPHFADGMVMQGPSRQGGTEIIHFQPVYLTIPKEVVVVPSKQQLQALQPDHFPFNKTNEKNVHTFEHGQQLQLCLLPTYLQKIIIISRQLDTLRCSADWTPQSLPSNIPDFIYQEFIILLGVTVSLKIIE